MVVAWSIAASLASRGFPGMQCVFPDFSPAIAAERTALLNHAMTRDDDSDRVRTYGGAYCSSRLGGANRLRDLVVTDKSARWNFQQRPPDIHLEIGAGDAQR